MRAGEIFAAAGLPDQTASAGGCPCGSDIGGSDGQYVRGRRLAGKSLPSRMCASASVTGAGAPSSRSVMRNANAPFSRRTELSALANCGIPLRYGERRCAASARDEHARIDLLRRLRKTASLHDSPVLTYILDLLSCLTGMRALLDSQLMQLIPTEDHRTGLLHAARSPDQCRSGKDGRDQQRMDFGSHRHRRTAYCGAGDGHVRSGD